MAPISFNSNVSSQRVQRELLRASASLGKSYERLSTGMRINRASDDAAGLAIADQLKTNARLYSAASRNINDGVSVLNIMDGALEQQSNAVQRLIELAQQSSNGSLSNSQRNALSSEYQALVREISRVGDTTSFNGLQLLRGFRGNASQILIQAGITGSSPSRLGITTTDTGTLSGKVDLSGVTSDVFGASYSNTEQLLNAYNGVVLRATVGKPGGGTVDLLIGITYDNADPYGDDESMMGFNLYAPNSSGTGWTFQSSGSFSYFTETGRTDPNDVLGNPDVHQINFLHGGANLSYTLDLRGLTFVGQTAGGKPGYLAMDGTELAFSGVETQTSARSALTYAKARLNELSTVRGDIGAISSRLLSALGVSQVSEEGVRSAEQRIRDADVAEEAALLTASQIRQQTASQVLSLANLGPQLLLSLIQESG